MTAEKMKERVRTETIYNIIDSLEHRVAECNYNLGIILMQDDEENTIAYKRSALEEIVRVLENLL